MTTTLRIELKVRDYDMWRAAFDRDAAGRQQAGMRRYQIFRPVDDPNCVMVDGDFDRAEDAEAFLDTMRTKVWPDADKAPAKLGTPQSRILEMVESREYQSSAS